MTHKVWFNERLIIDYDIDNAWLQNKTGYRGFVHNAYANVNQETNGIDCIEAGRCTTETTYRYNDNYDVRSGPPVSCESIGFPAASGPGVTAPAAPILLP